MNSCCDNDDSVSGCHANDDSEGFSRMTYHKYLASIAEVKADSTTYQAIRSMANSVKSFDEKTTDLLIASRILCVFVGCPKDYAGELGPIHIGLASMLLEYEAKFLDALVFETHGDQCAVRVALQEQWAADTQMVAILEDFLGRYAVMIHAARAHFAAHEHEFAEYVKKTRGISAENINEPETQDLLREVLGGDE